MFQKLTGTILLMALCCTLSFGQETWTIEKCIQYSQQNSLRVKQAENSVEQAQLTEQESKNARYPDLNASTSGNVSFGRTIDPVTNQFVSQTIGSNSLSINGGITVYNGGRIRNTIKQSGIAVEAAKSNTEQIKTDIALQVAQAYLQVLLDEEALANADKRLEQTQAQLEQTDKLIQAGTRPQSERLEIIAQIARDEQAIVSQQNAVEISYLNLKQLLELKPDYEFQVEKPSVVIPGNANPEAYTLDAVYNKALNNQPMIRRDELNVKSSELGIDIAKSLRLPSVRFFANVNSFYSNQVLELLDEGTDAFDDAIPTLINGSNAAVQFPTKVDQVFGRRSYFNQLNDNFGQGIGVSVNIPIYNQNQTKIAMERAKLDVLNRQITSQQNKQQLKTDIQRAIANARANKKQFEASEKTVAALKDTYRNTEKRYQLGAVNTFEFTTAKNNLDQSEVDLIIAKYNYLYSLKVVDFYQGKKITLR
ncbi:MAG: TolC family protein [Bacteroidota bacterium]